MIALNRIKQYRLYRKGIKAGYIKKTVQNGQTIWFIKLDAPLEVKKLSEDLPNIELEYVYISYGFKTISACLMLAIVLRIFGIDI